MPIPIQIREVESKRLMRRFISFPRKLYRDDPLWVPPLWIEERKLYTRKNPILFHSDYVLFIAMKKREVVGRVLSYVDHNFNRHFDSAVGFFGSFECVNDPAVAEALFDRVEGWMKSHGMTAVRGPINPVSECWGFLYKGCESPPVYMTPFNPFYYNDLMESLSYVKIMDLLAYEGDAKKGYQIPDRFLRFRREMLARNPHLKIRRLDFKKLASEAEHIWRISNVSLQDNWGYVPLDRDELTAMFCKLRIIADRDAILIIESSGIPVGYCLGFPDLNIITKQIRGRLFPFGFAKLFFRIRKVTDFRLWALALLPEYQNRGLDVLLYTTLCGYLKPRMVRLEANWVLENNARMRNALEKLNFMQTKVYRIYEKSLSKTIC